MRVIGIDSGLTGALAAIDERSGELRFFADLPRASEGSVSWIDGGKLLSMLFRAREDEPARVVIEYMHALPTLKDEGEERRRSARAEFGKGCALASILSIVQIARLPYRLIVPQRWKRPLGLIGVGETYADRKRASLEFARKLFPDANLRAASSHNRAEAILIAYWAQRYTSAGSGELALTGGGKAA